MYDISIYSSLVYKEYIEMKKIKTLHMRRKEDYNKVIEVIANYILYESSTPHDDIEGLLRWKYPTKENLLSNYPIKIEEL